MIKHLLTTAFAIALITAGSSDTYAQQANPGSSPFATEEVQEAYELKSFNASGRNGKVYVNWTVTDATGECVYIVERSADGKNYQKITAKKGAPSPGTSPLMFSYVDEQPLVGKAYYRVTRASFSGNTYTAAVSVENIPVKNGAVLSGLASNK